MSPASEANPNKEENPEPKDHLNIFLENEQTQEVVERVESLRYFRYETLDVPSDLEPEIKPTPA